MIKFERTEVFGWKAAIRGMRNPLNSWKRSDSIYDVDWTDDSVFPHRNVHDDVVLGDNDYDLMKRLIKSGSEHRKFMRMIHVQVDITAGHTWWSEFDTYKVSTVRNSCSKMHKIHVKEFVKDDFDHEGIDDVADALVDSTFENLINTLERLRCLFNATKEKRYWRAMIELLPMGYHLKATVDLNYETIYSAYHQRLNHKMDEWNVGFTGWVKSLPCSELIVGENV